MAMSSVSNGVRVKMLDTRWKMGQGNDAGDHKFQITNIK
jgi:hypothetical protein